MWICREIDVGYGIYYYSYPENGLIQLLGKDVRPRARTVYQWHQLEQGMVVMVNYNPDDPKERGYWYDAQIQRKRETRTLREIYAKIILGWVCYSSRYVVPLRCQIVWRIYHHVLFYILNVLKMVFSTYEYFLCLFCFLDTQCTVLP